MDWFWRWMSTREGVVALVIAAVITAAFVQTLRDLATAPVVFLVAAALGWVLVKIAASAWERSTWPAAAAFAKRSSSTSGTKVLRGDGNATIFRDRGGFLFEVRWFFTATSLPPVRLSPEFVEWARDASESQPVAVFDSGQRRWWWYRNAFYWENAGYEPRDVQALVIRKERRHQRDLERAHTLLKLEESGGPRREPIPETVRRAVFDRDGGRCVQCGANFDIQYDHLIPVALGGATSVENLQLLCGACNREKGTSI